MVAVPLAVLRLSVLRPYQIGAPASSLSMTEMYSLGPVIAPEYSILMSPPWSVVEAAALSTLKPLRLLSSSVSFHSLPV